MHALQNDPAFHMCLGPGCGSGQYHEKTEAMVCAACEFRTCTTHGMPWHTGQTCQQYDEAVAAQLKQAQQEIAETERAAEAKRQQKLRDAYAASQKAAAEAEAERLRVLAAEAAKQKAAAEAAQRDKEAKEASEREDRVRRQQLIDNAASQAVVTRIAKTCPGPHGRTCGAQIQKTSGCNHITCMSSFPRIMTLSCRKLLAIGHPFIECDLI